MAASQASKMTVYGGNKMGNQMGNQMGGNPARMLQQRQQIGGNSSRMLQQRQSQFGGSLTNVINQVKDQQMVLTDQALVIAIAYSLLIVALLVPIQGRPYNFGERFMAILSLLFPFFVTVYIINCMTTCSSETYCGFWGWVFVVFTLLWCVLLLLSVVYVAIMGVPKNEVVSENKNVEGMKNEISANKPKASNEDDTVAVAVASNNAKTNAVAYMGKQNNEVVMPEEVVGSNSNTHYMSVNEAVHTMPVSSAPVGMVAEGFSTNMPL